MRELRGGFELHITQAVLFEQVFFRMHLLGCVLAVLHAEKEFFADALMYDLCVRVLREVQRVARNGRIAACECAVNEFGV